MGWRGYIHHPRKTVFFWSQKAACTSLFGFLAEDVEVPRSDKKFFHTNSDPYPACLRALRRQRYRSVIQVRHPVTRIISAYINKFCLYRSRPLQTRGDLEPFARDLHDLHCRMHGIAGEEAEINSMSFAQFLDTIAQRRADHPVPEHPINGHWETQVPAFLLERGLYYDRVLHVETLKDDLTALARELGMPYTPRQMNRTHLPEAAFDGVLVEVPAREITGYDFSYDNFITPATLARIHDMYRADFTTFGYPLAPHPKGQPYRFRAPRRSWRSRLPYFPR